VAELGLPLRDALHQFHAWSLRAVQLSASGPAGLRPREMTESEQRDVGATLRRLELRCAGIDLWIPPEHFVDAVDACCQFASRVSCGSISLSLPDDGLAGEVIEAMTSSSAKHGVVLAVLRSLDAGVPEGMVSCVDPAASLSQGGDPIMAAADAAAAVRLSDLASGARIAPGQSGGRLDVAAYQAACSVGGSDRPVVADLRWMIDPVASLSLIRQAWGR
jgi:hypothetical protein